MTTSKRAVKGSIRVRLGRWLIRPEAARIYFHYVAAAEDHRRNGDHERENHCTYIAIGAGYVGRGWPHD